MDQLLPASKVALSQQVVDSAHDLVRVEQDCITCHRSSCLNTFMLRTQTTPQNPAAIDVGKPVLQIDGSED